MTEHSKIEILIIVEVEPMGVDGSWEVANVVDTNDKTSLGNISIYYFDGDSDFMTDLERAVLESLIENEGFDAETFYTLTISVRNGGAKLGSSSTSFYGSNVPHPPRNWRAARLWPSVALYLPYLGRNEWLEES